MHKVSIVDIDEEGLLTATGITHYISEEDMKNNRDITLTMKQWVGLITQFLTSLHGLTDEKAKEAAEDIVCRCFIITGAPKIEELNKYLKNYLNR